MKLAPLPPDEKERQEAVDEAGMVGLAKEERFDRITRITRKLFRAPCAILTVIDKDRAIFKSNALDDKGAESVSMGDSARDVGFCAHTILSEETLIVPDSHKDERFHDNPHVTSGLKVRFYVGKPIHTPNGQRVGTICVVDRVPRQVTAEDLTSLNDMAKIVEEEIKKNIVNLSPELIERLGENMTTRAIHSNFKEKIMGLRQVVNKRKKSKSKLRSDKDKKDNT